MKELRKNSPTSSKKEPCEFTVIAVQFVDQILDKAMHTISTNLSEVSSEDLDFCYMKDQALIPSPESGCHAAGAGPQQRLSESDIQKAFLDKMDWKRDDREHLSATRGQGDVFNTARHTDIIINMANTVFAAENDENPPPEITEAKLDKKDYNSAEAVLETVDMQCIDWKFADVEAVEGRKDRDEENVKGFQCQAQGDTPFAPLSRSERDFIEAKAISRSERGEIEEELEMFLRTIESSKDSPRPLGRKCELAARSANTQPAIQFSGHPYEEEVYLTLNSQHDRYYDTAGDQETGDVESEGSLHLEEVTLTQSASRALDCRMSKCELDVCADLKVIQKLAKGSTNRISDEAKSPEKVKSVGTALGRAWRAICRVFGGQHRRSSSSPPKRKPSAPYRKTPSPKRKMYSMSDLESPERDNESLNRYTILEPHFSNSLTPEMANISLPGRLMSAPEDMSRSGLRRSNSERKWGTFCSKNCSAGDHKRQSVGRPLQRKSASMGANCAMS